jgi:hypothetical protein
VPARHGDTDRRFTERGSVVDAVSEHRHRAAFLDLLGNKRRSSVPAGVRNRPDDAKAIGDGLRHRLCISGQQDNFDAHIRERLYRCRGAVTQLIRYQNGAKIAASLRDQDPGSVSGRSSLRPFNPEFRKQCSVADYGLLSTDQGQYAVANPILEIIGIRERSILAFCKSERWRAQSDAPNRSRHWQPH